MIADQYLIDEKEEKWREKCIIQTHWRPIAFKENAKEMHRMHKDSLNFFSMLNFLIYLDLR